LASDEQPLYAGSFKKEDAAGSAHMLVGPAPIKYSRWLSQAVGGSVWLKLECLHEGGSFKLRGATHALLAHRDRHHGRLPSRVYTASGGNHGLGVAIAAQRLGVPCTIVLPTNTPQHRCKCVRTLFLLLLLP
jgi:threonine dehydratase